ncbi:MAG: 4'-phosphopantetheinyl transferase superfamily protein [Prevotella sp.]|uniref:4'-phosphopantetheinyl transferase family protein n=1 Tax=Prevotella sp. TaxID=59823 RepID=UPI002A347B95|nr:4'-phosphopantetheinyl transferase superfamily protein [Prevotella sp.]MDD7318882.1 4'-phosphopantetheinyl transferase superfamily protein [Prevotellaceae bacterium]MDY4019261.1 4'-phosphopantetheinyl transferase superfamily protein [Prevotella sp.]
MPLLRIDKHSDFVTGLWKISDDDVAIMQDCHLKEIVSEAEISFKSDARRQEFVAERLLLREILNGEWAEIRHNEDGKPILSGSHNISISHTRGYVAMILSEQYEVGIDIEYPNSRVEKIAGRFMREDEHAYDAKSLLIHWCAKEAVYKLFSSQHLELKEMRVNSETLAVVTNLRSGIDVSLFVETTPEYTLAYSLFGENCGYMEKKY